MGFLDFLSGFKRVTCPRCGTPDALKDRYGEIRCKNSSCSEFDANWARGLKSRVAKRTTIPASGDFHPANPIRVRYRNFAGQDRTFTMDSESMGRVKNHLSGRATPAGAFIALSRDRIQNLAEVEAQLPRHLVAAQPSPDEWRILSYHKIHGTTSPLYEKIRAKYPYLR